MDYKEDIIKLKGVGEKTAVLFNKIGVFSFGDLLYYFPRDYIRYEDVVKVDEGLTGKLIAFEAAVLSHPVMRKNGRLSVTSSRLMAGGERINAVWFNMPYLSKNLKAGYRYIFYGRLYKKGNSLCTDQPVIFKREEFDEIKNSLQPVYSLTKGLTNNMVKKSVKQLLSGLEKEKRDAAGKGAEKKEPYFDEKYDYDYDFGAMHFPSSIEELKRARERFVYDEFFMYILRLRFLKQENSRAKNTFNIIECAETERMIEALPYRLTKAQERVWDEIRCDLTKKSSMNRLVQGDVGSGKTVIAILAAVMTAVNGYQSAVMAPTEILAAQHFEALCAMIKKQGLDVGCALLTGSTPAAAKRAIYKDIETGKTQIIVGTHALFQEKVRYNDLALVITDEQHRFGVAQREALLNKNPGNSPHVLVMSATPIPRTLAIILYGDLDISVIDEVPAKRLPIKNCVVDESYHEKAYRFMQKEIDAGHQCYVICPLAEESEQTQGLKDVQSYTDILRAYFPASVNISCLYGKLKPMAKAKVMDDFYRNNIQILVSTTVVEVGVNVPNATVMMIENAERFGLAQLHQLRGRIGRGDSQSYCIFINCSEKEENKERLDILVSSNDGFEIASKDLELRGPGDLFGLRQSGELVFKLADVFIDSAVLKRAASDVGRLLEEDPELCKPEHKALKERLSALISEQGTTAL